MTPERWQQVKQIFHAALDRAPGDRSAFLASACGGDDAMQQEVESLITSHEKEGSFMDSPAYEAAAGTLASDPELTLGQTIGHYEVLSTLGKGGMGEVCLARDISLGRKVALKFLPRDFTRDPDRLRRFEQEARAASALNHPSIITIYEIGEVDGRHFIATEFIDGKTLRQHVLGGPLRLAEALNIAEQIASSLAEAHAAGIVHRDIKPENVMLRRDGLVKVLDFGLAKLTERKETGRAEDPTLALVKTSTGVVMGTTAYMSPEQARGLNVDARTDIWSLGVVLYEMIAGRAPFAAATPSDMLVSILDRDPQPLSDQLSEVPAELERIVRKALQKDRDERHQVVRDMALDLKSLRRELEIEAELERSVRPRLSNDAPLVPTGGQTTVTPARETGEATAAYSTKGFQSALSQINRPGARVVLNLAMVSIAVAAISFGLYKFLGGKKARAPFQTTTAIKLTTSGNASDGAISRDGKYVAYVLDEAGKQSLWVRQVAAASNVRIAPPSESGYRWPIFSRDGNYIYYINNSRELYQVAVLGGAAKRIATDVEGPVTFSPDGKQMAYTRRSLISTQSPLVVTNLDGTGERTLASRKSPEFLWGPAWSPDGKVIAFAAGRTNFELFEVRLADGRENQISSQKWLWTDRIAWLSDGSGLVVTAMAQSSPFQQVWEISYPGGDTRRIISDLNQYNSLSLTADSSTLVTVQSNDVSNIWITTRGDAGQAKQVTFGVGRRPDLAWTPDGKIIYASDASGRADIWMMEADGTEEKQLTSDAGRNYAPTASRDGRYILFHSDRTGAWNIWKMNTEGANPKQLTLGEWPSCSPDGQWVVYVVKGILWKMRIDGSEPVQLTDKDTFAWAPVVSPKGGLVACWYKELESSPGKVAIIPLDGGRPTKILDLPGLIANTGPAYRWTADGQALIFGSNNNGVSNLWLQRLDGSQAKQLTNFKSEFITSFDLSRDGRLIISRGTSISDVVLISEAK